MASVRCSFVTGSLGLAKICPKVWKGFWGMWSTLTQVNLIRKIYRLCYKLVLAIIILTSYQEQGINVYLSFLMKKFSNVPCSIFQLFAVDKDCSTGIDQIFIASFILRTQKTLAVTTAEMPFRNIDISLKKQKTFRK